jgi:peptidoglycan/xylan/chitin deacetylase (PgdA/CDA1 family)
MIRRLLVAFKELLDRIRPWVDVYSHILRISPAPVTTARLLGAVVDTSARLDGDLLLYQPAWFQANSGARARAVRQGPGAFVLLDHDARLTENAVFQAPAIVTPQGVRTGCEVAPAAVTISLDLEGAVGLSQLAEPRFSALKRNWRSKDAARRMLDVFDEFLFPTTWAVCGHLFMDRCDGRHGYPDDARWLGHDPGADAESRPDWYMPDLVRDLIAHPRVEVGYHSFAHVNHIAADAATVAHDVKLARQLRVDFGIPLDSYVLPYNAVGHVDALVAGGFSKLRGYIGQYYLPHTVDFGDFRFFGTSMYFGPSNIAARIGKVRECVGRNFNYFTHPEDWVGADLAPFRAWCARLAALRDEGKIVVKSMGEE